MNVFLLCSIIFSLNILLKLFIVIDIRFKLCISESIYFSDEDSFLFNGVIPGQRNADMKLAW